MGDQPGKRSSPKLAGAHRQYGMPDFNAAARLGTCKEMGKCLPKLTCRASTLNWYQFNSC